jgi:hypothetical protein
MIKTTVEKKENGHFEVSFFDGLSDVAFYDASLAQLMKSIINQVPYREPKSISWVDDTPKK